MSLLELTERGAPAPGSATLMLIDSYGLIYRAFFALPLLTTTKGVPINAAYGFTMMLTKIIADEKPTHVIAAFDKGLPAGRIEQFEAYKAQRQETPDDLRGQFSLVRRILETYRIPVIEMEGQEADDVIATLAREASQSGQRVLVVTGDLDLLQVVDDHTTVLTTKRGITDLGRYDAAAVRARFELEPAQLPDYRGLKGDPSDNLPGIPGIGEKTAIKLIKAAGSLDALLANPALAGTPKLENLVREHGETARVCRDVSVIARDLPLEIPWENCRYTPPSNDDLYVLYRDLEFKTLLAKLAAPADGSPAESAFEKIRGSYVDFSAATDPPDFLKLAELIAQLGALPRVALAVAGEQFALSAEPEKALSFSLAAFGVAHVREAVRALVKRVPQLVAHDAKALFGKLMRAGVVELSDLRAFADDTMVAAHLLDPGRDYLKLGDAVNDLLELDLPAEAAAAADAVVRLAPVARDRLLHTSQLALYENVELPLVPVLTKLEAAGITIDLERLREVGDEVDAAVVRLQDEVFALAGETFNLGSPQQLGRILFEKLALPGGKQNKTGWATGVEVLQGLARDYPVCARVLDFREVSKLKNTYIDVIPRLLEGGDGRLRTTFNQTSTATGRLNSTNPNLQNIPVRSEIGRRIRKAFVAPDARSVLLAADYSQIELRLMAHLSGDAEMRRAFAEGQDIHDFTARQIFGLGPLLPVDPNQRRMAKSVNFGLLYGMSDFGLAQRLEISRGEAKAITEAYFARFPSVRAHIEATLEKGRELGYVETILGRRRYMPDLRSRNHALRAAAEREATNAPLQGSAADLMKLAMLRVDRVLTERGSDATMLLQIHDELILEVAAAQVHEVAAAIKPAMEDALPLSVPVEVTMKSGRSWYDVEPLHAP